MTPLQKAAQAMLKSIADDKWIESYEELRLALDAELAQAVQPVLWASKTHLKQLQTNKLMEVWSNSPDLWIDKIPDELTPLYAHPPKL